MHKKAGESLLLAIYKNKQGGLNKLRHKVFMEKLGGKTAVKPGNLPPTEDSANLHFLRVYPSNTNTAWIQFRPTFI